MYKNMYNSIEVEVKVNSQVHVQQKHHKAGIHIRPLGNSVM